MERWSYIGADADHRMARLGSTPSFEAVVHALRLAPPVCFHREPRQRGDPCWRSVLCLNVGEEVFDQFFNCSTGYRGKFFESQGAGITANSSLFAELGGHFVALALMQEPREDERWIRASFSQPSAKAWLGEDTKALCKKCLGGWSPSYHSSVKIRNGRWEKSPHTHAAWGTQAPNLSMLRFFGGFLDEASREWLPEEKRERAKHIYDHGWT